MHCVNCANSRKSWRTVTAWSGFRVIVSCSSPIMPCLGNTKFTLWSMDFWDTNANQSINQTSIVPISPAKPGSVAQQANQCSTAKSSKQFRKWGANTFILLSEIVNVFGVCYLKHDIISVWNINMSVLGLILGYIVLFIRNIWMGHISKFLGRKNTFNLISECDQ